ncbi:2-amino-3,7-dideoxy-D-threo-hept-6-ulosonate synthase [Kibdelosporangium phytohabitans]|uniref:Fructose-bisphosphate aldolase n=1 Tax=Kibdelosporangium phytohabitans TaxID=860235 RepID=A0A0N9I285_9PSEU|nr:2-amino-3,7-dideoxy-D-threo-hept-6-ulosonate synthase [Kibdelosporangium phytohabitans]ALG09969.1 fructose-bisphosphate aldolase [Kibdelosporangium phytohabitans]MBE1468615.1 2-amino-4,5-dihydroxy-6-oxo-7-(phosphonooxy)heptanoate synthase [Kibdelosporangium phytohabitans]
MSRTPLTGKTLRMARLSRPRDDRYLFVPLDHSMADGPITDEADFNQLVSDISLGGADAIVVHKGRSRTIEPELLGGCALIVHLSASTDHAVDSDAKVLVSDVEEALRLGADAVSVHVNVGSDTEAIQLAALGAVASACDQWGVPLLAMIYLRGPRVIHPNSPQQLSHMVSIAADMGADLVKTVLAAPIERMTEVTAASPLPVVVAGGDGHDMSLFDFATAAMAVGCHGLAVGRRVFTDDTPRRVVHQLATIVHGEEFTPETALRAHLAGTL